MTFHEILRSRKGGLLRIKSELYWYDIRNLDKRPGRICLILDAVPGSDAHIDAGGSVSMITEATVVNSAAALLLVDGSPRCVWLVESDVEVFDETR